MSTTLERTPPRQRLCFRHLLLSEALKLSSLRSTVLLLGAMLVLGIGVSVLYALTAEQGGIPDRPSTAFSLDALTLGTVLFGQIIAGVLGVLAISGEYSSGTIQSTLVAVPRRLPVLVAKALVLLPLTTATALVSLLGSWGATAPLYAELGILTEATDPGFLPALLGGALYVGLCSLFGLGVGTLLRSAAAASIVVIATTLLVPVLTSVLPTSETVRFVRLVLLPHAGDSMLRLGDPALGFADVSQQYLSPLAGAIVAAVWAGAALVAGAVALRRRDA
jgi:ABC-2 type transport system permease protein